MIIGDKMRKFKLKYPTKTKNFVVAGYGYIGRRVKFVKFKQQKGGWITATTFGEDFRHPLYSGQTTRVWNERKKEIDFKIDVESKLLTIGGQVFKFTDNRDLWRKIAEVSDPSNRMIW